MRVAGIPGPKMKVTLTYDAGHGGRMDGSLTVQGKGCVCLWFDATMVPQSKALPESVLEKAD